MAALAPHVASLANYVRGQTWLAPPFSMDMVQDLLGRAPSAAEDDCESFSPRVGRSWAPQLTRYWIVTLRPEEIERFQSDVEYFDRVRHTIENSINVSALAAVSFVAHSRDVEC